MEHIRYFDKDSYEKQLRKTIAELTQEIEDATNIENLLNSNNPGWKAFIKFLEKRKQRILDHLLESNSDATLVNKVIDFETKRELCKEIDYILKSGQGLVDNAIKAQSEINKLTEELEKMGAQKEDIFTAR